LLAIEEHRNQEPDDPNALVGNIAHQVAFTPDGKILAAAMSDKTIKLWNGKTGELLARSQDITMPFMRSQLAQMVRLNQWQF
jgi:WD40 repeat protein